MSWGYPSKKELYNWILNERTVKPARKGLLLVNTAEHHRTPPFEVKMEAIHRCFQLGENVKSVSKEIGYTRASIYSWRKKYLQERTAALMNDKDIKPDTLTESSTDSSPDLAQLQAQSRDMQMRIDIWKETINSLKKDPGIDQKTLKNREKAVIIDALNKYSLSVLLAQLGISKSSYHYQETVMKKSDKYMNLRSMIWSIFHENS